MTGFVLSAFSSSPPCRFLCPGRSFRRFFRPKMLVARGSRAFRLAGVLQGPVLAPMRLTAPLPSPPTLTADPSEHSYRSRPKTRLPRGTHSRAAWLSIVRLKVPSSGLTTRKQLTLREDPDSRPTAGRPPLEHDRAAADGAETGGHTRTATHERRQLYRNLGPDMFGGTQSCKRSTLCRCVV